MKKKPHNTVRFDSDLKPPGKDLLGKVHETEALETKIVEIDGHSTCVVTGELWTSGQRQAASIHEVSYRACFKPQLPAYFIKRFTSPGDVVYDPFSGRGTTCVEAALSGRTVIANDVNPVSAILSRPRLSVPSIEHVEQRLLKIPYKKTVRSDIDLSMFYDPATESEIVSLKNYLESQRKSGSENSVDEWIRMVATNRLTGHSPGFFSVYTFPPNQAVSADAQRKINKQRGQTPVYKNTKDLILRKSKQLLRGLAPQQIDALRSASHTARFLCCDARSTFEIEPETVQLTVTSPPFLDVVQYADDNWLRCWFNSIPLSEISQRISMTSTIEQWNTVMQGVFHELFRITRKSGIVAFEVGEVRNGKVKLEEHVVPLALNAGFSCEAILINQQVFTKTSNIWGVSNNKRGTNSNRIVVLRK